MIEFSLENVEVPGLNPELFILWLKKVCVSEHKQCGDISIVFVTDEALLEMNRQYLDHDYYTDIITFDYSENDVVSGDLFISIDRVVDNAKTYAYDYGVELKRVCVHGVLHLCGYKDKTESDELIMRQKEDFYIEKFVPRETRR